MNMNLFSRRDMLKMSGCGFGYLAFAGLAAKNAQATSPATARNPLAPRDPHFEPRAKRVIFLYMRGGPPHVDMFDYKARLMQASPASSSTARERGRGRQLLRPPYHFQQFGESGMHISSVMPNIGRHADKLCVINSMHTDVPNHPQACLMLHTGEFRFTRPSMGSWILYGLGTENQDLPGFITIKPPTNLGGAQNYSNAFLPAAYQATRIGYDNQRISEARIGNLGNTQVSGPAQRQQLDLLQSLNRRLLERQQVNNELEGVIDSYELAFRMQTAVPRLMDLTNESQQTLDSYGIGNRRVTDDFGRQCLMARRFVEAGVRFVEVSHSNWDLHNNLRQRLQTNCNQIDQPIGALLSDLEQRGLLQDTLVIWGGEFGRTPTGQGTNGRSHNSAGFSMWLAGGGVRGGQRLGATDEIGARAVENRVHQHDLHATALHLLGLDHERLTYSYGGRDYSLTDIHGRIVREIIA